MPQPEQPQQPRAPKPKQSKPDDKARLAQAGRRFAPPPRRFLRKLAGRR